MNKLTTTFDDGEQKVIVTLEEVNGQTKVSIEFEPERTKESIAETFAVKYCRAIGIND